VHASNGSDIRDGIVVLLVHLLATPLVAVLKLGDEPALDGSSSTKDGGNGEPNEGQLPSLHQRPDEANTEHSNDDDALTRDGGHEFARGLRVLHEQLDEKRRVVLALVEPRLVLPHDQPERALPDLTDPVHSCDLEEEVLQPAGHSIGEREEEHNDRVLVHRRLGLVAVGDSHDELREEERKDGRDRAVQQRDEQAAEENDPRLGGDARPEDCEELHERHPWLLVRIALLRNRDALHDRLERRDGLSSRAQGPLRFEPTGFRLEHPMRLLFLPLAPG